MPPVTPATAGVLRGARVAVVHDWLVDFAGAESALAEILRCFPDADLYTLVDHMPPAERARLGARPSRTSFLQHLPGSATRLRYYLPLLPLAIEQFDLTGYDLVISVSHAVAKGVIVPPDALHVSYLCSPMRYAWDLQPEYLQDSPGLAGAPLRWLLHRLRLWDHRSAAGVDRFLAISAFVARRTLKAYRRKADVLAPPVDVTRFTPADGPREEAYLTVSRLWRYKRVDLLVEAFRAMPARRLVVIGEGPELERLRAGAPPNVSFLGRQPDGVVVDWMRRARAFLFAATEDFGIAPLEALACGTPVLALRRGGAAETCAGLDDPSPVGAWIEAPTAEAVGRAVERFEAEGARIRAQDCRRRAEAYAADRFRAAFLAYVEARYAEWQAYRRGEAAWPDG